MTHIPIAFSVDDNMVIPAMVALHSLLKSSGKSTFYAIHVLYIELDDENIQKISQSLSKHERFTLTFIDCAAHLNVGFEIRKITKTAYLRLLIPRLLTQYPKVLYVDVDVVFTDDLSDVFAMDLGDNAIAAVPNDVVSRRHQRRLGIRSLYINSGVLLLQCANIADDKVAECIAHVKKRKYKYQDQDIISVVFEEKVIPLIEPRYNITPKRLNKILKGNVHFLKQYYTDQAIADMLNLKGIIHYTGPKPWNAPNICLADLWWAYFHFAGMDEQHFYFAYQRKVKKYIKLF